MVLSTHRWGASMSIGLPKPLLPFSPGRWFTWFTFTNIYKYIKADANSYYDNNDDSDTLWVKQVALEPIRTIFAELLSLLIERRWKCHKNGRTVLQQKKPADDETMRSSHLRPFDDVTSGKNRHHSRHHPTSTAKHHHFTNQILKSWFHGKITLNLFQANIPSCAECWGLRRSPTPRPRPRARGC